MWVMVGLAMVAGSVEAGLPAVPVFKKSEGGYVGMRIPAILRLPGTPNLLPGWLELYSIQSGGGGVGVLV